MRLFEDCKKDLYKLFLEKGGPKIMWKKVTQDTYDNKEGPKDYIQHFENIESKKCAY